MWFVYFLLVPIGEFAIRFIGFFCFFLNGFLLQVKVVPEKAWRRTKAHHGGLILSSSPAEPLENADFSNPQTFQFSAKCPKIDSSWDIVWVPIIFQDTRWSQLGMCLILSNYVLFDPVWRPGVTSSRSRGNAGTEAIADSSWDHNTGRLRRMKKESYGFVSLDQDLSICWENSWERMMGMGQWVGQSYPPRFFFVHHFPRPFTMFTSSTWPRKMTHL